MLRKRYTSVVSILTAAIPLIEKGWTKGAMKETNDNGQVSYCALGALQQVSRSKEAAHRVQMLVEDTINEFDLTDWNDDINRRKRDVVSAFKRTIKAIA